MDIFEYSIILGWVILATAPGAIAFSRGNSFIVAFFLSLFLTPIVAGTLAATEEPNVKRLEMRRIKTGIWKKCPFCAELVRAEAVVCRHCGKEFVTTAR